MKKINFQKCFFFFVLKLVNKWSIYFFTSSPLDLLLHLFSGTSMDPSIQYTNINQNTANLQPSNHTTFHPIRLTSTHLTQPINRIRFHPNPSIRINLTRAYPTKLIKTQPKLATPTTPPSNQPTTLPANQLTTHPTIKLMESKPSRRVPPPRR